MDFKKHSNYYFSEYAIIGYLALAKILIHLLLPEYGIFRDEYFYMAVADQFSFQNLDMMPLTPLFLKFITAIFGYSIKAVHLASGLLGAATLVFACLIAKELGGKKYAILLTGIFYVLSGPIIFGALFSYDSFDFLIQVTSIYILVRLFKENKPQLWISLGVLLGFGLLNKMTILFFGLAIFVALWLVPQREFYKKPWIWLAGIIALLYALPFIFWQSAHDWYFLDFATSYSGGIAYTPGFFEFIWIQIIPNNALAFPIWILGLYLLLFSKHWKSYRFFGFMYVFLFFLYYFVGAKFYFLIPVYAILIAVGSIKIEQWITDKNLYKTKLLIPIAYVILSLPYLPLVVPILPIGQLVNYVGYFGVNAGVRTESSEISNLPQHIADRFSWKEFAEQIKDIYNSVSNEVNSEVGIITENWGQASAIHYYRENYKLPEPISLHGWYYYNSLQNHDFKKHYIAVQLPKEYLEQVFKKVEEKAVFTHPYALPHENNKPIYFCSEPKVNLKDFWLVQKRINPEFENILNENGVQAAIDFYFQSLQNDSSIMFFSENQINSLGYVYLFNGQIDDAIALFKLNVKVFPHSWNVYDSLGEGYMRNGQYELAVDFYNKSIEINPDNTNGMEMLKSIEKIRNDQ